jgi:hypothetical protein
VFGGEKTPIDAVHTAQLRVAIAQVRHVRKRSICRSAAIHDPRAISFAACYAADFENWRDDDSLGVFNVIEVAAVCHDHRERDAPLRDPMADILLLRIRLKLVVFRVNDALLLRREGLFRQERQGHQGAAKRNVPEDVALREAYRIKSRQPQFLRSPALRVGELAEGCAHLGVVALWPIVGAAKIGFQATCVISHLGLAIMLDEHGV